MKKLNLYFGITLFALFLYTGHVLHSGFVATGGADGYARLQNRANHIYLLFVALFNLASFKWLFAQALKPVEPLARCLLVLAGLCAAVGFFVESATSVDRRMWMPAAVVCAFLAVALLLADEAYAKIKRSPKRMHESAPE